MKIVILEDDFRRVRQMTRLLQESSPDYEPVVFDSAPKLIAWLTEHQSEVSLFCLDHDLGANRLMDNGELEDPGTGRDVADYLSDLPPICPVVIHSSNVMAAPGMMMVLEEAGWSCCRLSPFNDLEWVKTEWIGHVQQALWEDESGPGTSVC